MPSANSVTAHASQRSPILQVFQGRLGGSTRVRTSPNLLALRPSWDSLVAQGAVRSLYQTWEWISAFMQIYGDLLGAELSCLEVWRDDRLLGIAPLYRTDLGVTGVRVRRLRLCPIGPIWTYQLPTDLDFLALPGEERAVGAAVAAHLLKGEADWDQLDLDGVTGDSLALEALVERLREAGLKTDVGSRGVCRHAELPASWPAYQQQLSKGYGKKVARYRRAFEKAHPSRLVVNQGAVLEDLDALVRLRLSSWRGAVPHAFSDGRFVAFHRILAPLLHQRGWLRLSFLEGADGQRLAGGYLTSFQGQVVFYQQAWRADLEDLHAGSVLIAALLEQAIDEGAGRFDFGCDAPYKEHWGQALRPQQRVRVYNRTLGGGGLWAYDCTRAAVGWARAQRCVAPRKGG